jgi:tetratricopeptide (TPR) repeat protein
MADIDSLWDYDDPAGTEQRFRALLPNCADDAQRAEALTQIARTFSLRRRFDDAHRTLDEANSLIANDQSRPYLRYLLERGRTFNSAGQRERASELFTQAWDLAREIGEENLAVDAAHMLAISEPAERQLEWNLRALDYAEQARDPRARDWLGSLYNNLGWTYHAAGDYAKALDQFERAVKVREAKGQAAPLRIAHWCVARCLRSLGRIEAALALQRRLLAELQTSGGSDGYVLEEIGECLLALNRADEARPHFAQAYAALSADPWLAESEPRRLERLKRLADSERFPPPSAAGAPQSS